MNYFFLLSISVHNWKALLIILFIGAVGGALAGLLARGRSMGLLASILLGIVGGWLCHTFFGNFFSITKSHLFNEIICATVGAIILTLIINLVFGGNKDRDKTTWKA